jgi:hypothetical protein
MALTILDAGVIIAILDSGDAHHAAATWPSLPIEVTVVAGSETP